MIGFQTALVERIRAVLAFRTAERALAPVEAPRQAVDHWTEVMKGLIAEHRFPFVTVCEALGLGQRHQDALALIAAPHLDDTIRDAIAAYHPTSRRHVDGALVVEMVSLNRAEAIAARTIFIDGGVLHQAGLAESAPVASSHVASALEHELVPTPRLLRILDGQAGLDPRFHGYASVVNADGWAHAGVMESARVDEISRLVTVSQLACGTRRGVALLLAGPHGVGKLRLARAIAARCGIPRLVTAEAALLPSDLGRLARVLESLAYEAELLGGRLVLRGLEHRAETAREAAALLAILRNLRHVVWATSDSDPRVDQGSHLAILAGLSISVPYPDLALRHDAWATESHAHGLNLADDKLRALAAEYPLTRSTIADVAASFATLSEPSADALAQLAEAKTPGQLGRYARRGRSLARVKDLVLPEHVREQLAELCNAVKSRNAVFDRWRLTERHAVGRGIVALFNGPPGTGKTMAANALANELGLPMYRIDTSNIVDRYVGETEKNLMRLFDEASASRAALLFDEADSLFGKRVEAQDSTDRHANMQTNLLLNLIEDYDGFVALTTNMKGAIDSAFLRRIMFKIGFDLPDLDERVALWNYHLPAEIPRARNVDLAGLARQFDRISGGDIKNAVIRSILSTRGEAPVTQELLEKSMASELRANGSVIVDDPRGSSGRSTLV